MLIIDDRKPHHRLVERRKMVIPKEEFDFESSNAKFEVDEGEVYPIESATVYSKSSFFDDISSESKDRVANEGYDTTLLIVRVDWREKMKEERNMNMETFGESSAKNVRGRRGRGRGRGGLPGRSQVIA